MTCEIDICSMLKKDISFALLMPRSRINQIPTAVLSRYLSCYNINSVSWPV
jgi:hypothetical protein